ncbi:MAG: hypothetical protein MUC49_15780 [Raineya sp.]|jgi:hypothetical protein|nr:hypothetical protein [Raineya sp.]
MAYSSKNLSISFNRATGKEFPVGASVALTSAGVLDTPTTHELTIGIVASNHEDFGRTTVDTIFTNTVKGIAKVNTNAGVLVKEVFTDSVTNNKPTYTLAAQGNYAIGIALTTATAGNEIEIGILAAPIVKS